jgi:alpha-beta hydrolase superfamily lysophospholipase
MHGAEDCVVPKRASEKLYAKLKVEDKTLKIYEGMRHEIFNEVEKEKPLKDLVDWISKHKLNSEQR